MKLAIFSDIHGNLPALEKMIKDVGVVDRYICLGDVVNYGPWSNECVEYLHTLQNTTILMGNHEEDFLCGKCRAVNSVAQDFFTHCFPSFIHHNIIKKYERKKIQVKKFILCHTINNQYIYPDSKIELKHDYIVGHSHFQCMINANGHVLYNVGSVGQNRKYINLISYATYNTDTNMFELKNIEYDIDGFIREMKQKNYPESCLNYYLNKSRI